MLPETAASIGDRRQPHGHAREEMNTTATVPRVLIVDDQALFRAGLARLLAGDERVNVVGEAADALEAVQKASSVKPDIVLMYLLLPNSDGIEVTRNIVAA